jgi:ubiquinone/menaquinone biosynthesis C-methylase UbiE
MSERKITFDDGAAYERMMGAWSRIAGETFLDWLAPAKGLAWVDIGCGNGAFTALIAERCAPALIKGIDPSAGQIDYARTRLASAPVELTTGDAMALPYADDSVDVAVMALVLFFVPDARKGFAEMVRVTKPGGLVAAYVWDIPGGGFPADAIWVELAAAGHPVPKPPSAAISKMDALKALWESALDDVETKVIEVERSFDGFEDYWDSCTQSSSIAAVLKSLSSEQTALIKERVRARLSGGRFTARAHAAKGKVRARAGNSS